MKLSTLGLAALCVLPVRALAAEPSPLPTPDATVQVGASSEQLSNGRGTWQSTYLLYVRRGVARHAVYGGVSNHRRFGQSDVQYLGGVYVPSSPNTILNVESSLSPTHLVLPQLQLNVSLDHRLANGWGYELGTGYRGYMGLHANSASLQIDRYWRSFRAAYKATGTQLSDTPGVSLSHSALFTHYYGSDGLSSITASVAAGREVENIGTGVLGMPVTSESLGGTHWFSHEFGASWVLENTRQGTVYTRSGGQIGLIRRL